MHIGCFDPYFAMVIDRAGHQNGTTSATNTYMLILIFN
jgi:hypothetical protein